MSARDPRFEIVRGADGWFARFKAANNREVWRTSETYKRVKGAENAVEVICGAFIRRHPWGCEIGWAGNAQHTTEVRYLDVRGEAGE